MEEARHFESLAALTGQRFTVHIAVDTGMGREGFLPSELGEVAPQLAALEHLHVEGVMSHFPAADEDVPFTQAEISCSRIAWRSCRGILPCATAT